MELLMSKFTPSPSPFRQSYVIEQTRTLVQGTVTPEALVPGGYLFQSRFGAQAGWWKQALQEQGKASQKAEPVTFAHVVKSFGAGSAAAAPPLFLARLPNTTPKADVVQFLINNNFSPHSADSLAGAVLEFAKSTFGKTILLGLTGGVATVAVVEAVRPNWSIGLKALCGLAGVVLFGAIYLLLKWLGVMT